MIDLFCHSLTESREFGFVLVVTGDPSNSQTIVNQMDRALALSSVIPETGVP